MDTYINTKWQNVKLIGNPVSHRKDSLREVLSVFLFYRYKVLSCSNCAAAVSLFFSTIMAVIFAIQTAYMLAEIDSEAFLFSQFSRNKTLSVL